MGFDYEADLLRLREIAFSRLEGLRSDMAAGPLINAAKSIDDQLAELHPVVRKPREGEPVDEFTKRLRERRSRSASSSGSAAG